jgi:chromosome segregation ATPase
VEDPIPPGALEWHPGPEAEELARRKAQLMMLSEELLRRERELDAYRVELHHFETRYRRTLGGRYARLDELADLLDAARDEADGARRAEPDPEDPAERYPGQGLPGGGQNWDWGEREPEPEPRPVIGEQAKRLFRQLARIIHPDLAGDPAERERRTNLMVAANLAYEQGDVAALEKLLDDWERSPEAVTGGGALAELERTVRRIAQVQARIDAIDEELAELEASAMGWLRRRTEKAAREGWDLLAHMVKELDRQILEAEVELERRAAAGGTPLAWPDGLTATR